MCNYVRSGTDWIPAEPLTYTSTRDAMRKGFTLWNLNKAVALYRKANPNDSWLNSTCMCSGLSTTSRSLTNFTTHVPISSHSTSQHCHQSSRCAPSLPPSLPTKQASQRESEHRAEIMNNCQKMSHGMTSAVHVQHEYAFCALGYLDVFSMSFALEFSFLIGQKVQWSFIVFLHSTLFRTKTFGLYKKNKIQEQFSLVTTLLNVKHAWEVLQPSHIHNVLFTLH